MEGGGAVESVLFTSSNDISALITVLSREDGV